MNNPAEELNQPQEVDSNLPGYELEEYIGNGSFGVVIRGTHESTGRPVAVKMIRIQGSKDYSKAVENGIANKEIAIMRRLVNPHVIQLCDVVHTTTHTCIVMEYARNGDFLDYLNARSNFNEDEARSFFRQLIAGVECCHQNMVAHRDLKLENLLLDDNYKLKISDFNLSTIMNEDYMLTGSCGSPPYAAPEVVEGNQYVGPPVDVWSCAVILHAILCGSYPFHYGDIREMYARAKNGMYELPKHLSSDVQDLIAKMFIVDPTKRITIPEIRQHPWFRA